jgi:hypothetical protein
LAALKPRVLQNLQRSRVSSRKRQRSGGGGKRLAGISERKPSSSGSNTHGQQSISSQEDEHDAANGAKDGINQASLHHRAQQRQRDGLVENEATELAFRKGTGERSESGDSHLIDVDGISDNSGTEDEAEKAQGQRKATNNSSKQIGMGGGEATRKRSYVRSKSGDSHLLILDEDDGWSGLPSWLRQWVSDGAVMFNVHEPLYKRGAQCAASRDHLAAQPSLQWFAIGLHAMCGGKRGVAAAAHGTRTMLIMMTCSLIIIATSAITLPCRVTLGRLGRGGTFTNK